MEIIKHGFMQNDWIAKCTECGAIIKAKENELKNLQQTDNLEQYSWESCPCCDFTFETACFHKCDTEYGKEIIKIYKSEKEK